MSAFLINPETMNKVIRAICSPAYYRPHNRMFAGYNVDRSNSWDKIGRALFALNVEAVSQRYPSERGKFHTFEEYRFEGIPYMRDRSEIVSCYKAAQCLAYQCSEGNVPEEAIYKELRDIILELQERIVAELDEYKAADWG
jgi:hypothetical protein